MSGKIGDLTAEELLDRIMYTQPQEVSILERGEYRQELLRRLSAAPSGAQARCPKCGAPMDQKTWESEDRNAVCVNLHVFPICHVADFAQFFSSQAAPAPAPAPTEKK